MKLLYQALSLLPAPLFLAGAIYSVLHTPAMCGAFPYEMTVMWFVMMLAHLTPWLIWWQQRDFTRR
jgi:hypothetical protein